MGARHLTKKSLWNNTCFAYKHYNEVCSKKCQTFAFSIQHSFFELVCHRILIFTSEFFSLNSSYLSLALFLNNQLLFFIIKGSNGSFYSLWFGTSTWLTNWKTTSIWWCKKSPRSLGLRNGVCSMTHLFVTK